MLFPGKTCGKPQLLTDRLAGIGAAYGTAKSGIGIAGVGTFRPDLIMKVSKCRTPAAGNRITARFSIADTGARPFPPGCSA